MMREGTNWWNSWRVGRWKEAMGQHGNGSNRPLLTGRTTDEEDGERGERRQGYGSIDEEDEEDEAEEAGPWVEPSAPHEHNAWSSN